MSKDLGLFLKDCQRWIPERSPVIVEGKLTRMVGLTLEAIGLNATVGERCLVIDRQNRIEAEVVGFQLEKARRGWLKLVAKLREPSRMGKIASGNHINALDRRPRCQAAQIAGLAGGAGVMGVDVEVGDVGHVIYFWA